MSESEPQPESEFPEAAPPPEPNAAVDEVADLKDKLLRALAEGENIRRRAQKEREDTSKYAIANFARDMLAIADNLRRALDNAPKDGSARSFTEGVELTARELQAALERHGIRKLDPNGERFDHNLHEAMFEVPTDHVPSGTVVQVVEPGYMIHDRLLRPARVGIAKGSGGGPVSIDTRV
jgi:molecular chaperone GrpE